MKKHNATKQPWRQRTGERRERRENRDAAESGHSGVISLLLVILQVHLDLLIGMKLGSHREKVKPSMLIS
jgi:hypothetical protein